LVECEKPSVKNLPGLFNFQAHDFIPANTFISCRDALIMQAKDIQPMTQAKKAKQAEKHKYDVAVIGGGLAGLTLSCLIGRSGARVVCIDQAPAEVKTGDLRTTAVSYGSSLILEDAGIWPRMQDKICPIRDIEILDGHSSVLLNFLSDEVGGKSFGWIAENAALRSAMMETVRSLDNVTHLTSCAVKDFVVNEEAATVILEGKPPVQASLVVGADGRGSFTRRWMGVRTRQWSYNQRAVICTVAHENPHDNVAVEHFWPEGPFAVLPMADDENGLHRSSVVFTEHGPESESLMKYSDEAFAAALASRFPDRYGAVRVICPRAAYPLGLVHAADYIAPRMALVADAAHGIHPIAGQGLNLGFRDVKELGTLVAEAVAAGRDPGAPELLETYQRRRRPDNMAMVAMTDGLNRLFSNNIAPVRLVRRVGLRLVSKIRPAKRFFMTQAMGDR
jgi:2-octaprenyl-6-methoxyphenol hydroxylase